MKTHWDHKTSPSTFVVSALEGKGKYSEWKIKFRGSYTDGMMYIKSLESDDGSISFSEDYLPAIRTVRRVAYRALMCEKELRREIIKLKKQLKNKNRSNYYDRL